MAGMNLPRLTYLCLAIVALLGLTTSPDR